MEQRPWSIDCLLRWLQVREDAGHPFPTSVKQLEVEVAHSALLNRLLMGKEPLPEPPPRARSYPWYALIEQGQAEPYEVYEAPADMEATLGYQALVIDKHPWKILKKVSEDEFVITYGSGSTTWRAHVIGRNEEVEKKLHEGKFNGDEYEHFAKRWMVERIDGPSPTVGEVTNAPSGH